MTKAAYFNAWTLAILASMTHVITADDDTVRPGRHLFIGVSGTALTGAERTLLREVQPAGVVLLGANVRDEAQTIELVSSIKEAAGLGTRLADLPLIAVDQEGGRINRLRLQDAPSASVIGATRDTSQARAAGLRYAKVCRERGIAVVLSPVLDAGRDGGNAIIGDRAFGDDPVLVESMGLAFAQGVMDAGAIPCAKHFPGHGSTKQDSHRALAVLEDTGDALQATLRPFRTCAAHGIPMLMAGHIAAPGLGEPDTPASMSPRILRDFLRDQWGYQGVLITDDINMAAVSPDSGAAAVQALAAGNDAVIYLDPRPDRVRSVVHAIEAAIASGALATVELARSEARLDAISDWLRVNEFLVNPYVPHAPESTPVPFVKQPRPAVPPLTEATEIAPTPSDTPSEHTTATQDFETKKANPEKRRQEREDAGPTCD